MQISVELILATKNVETGDIVVTLKRTAPRIILAELNTHLIISKSTASSRAIPTPRQLKNILKDPFIPISIGEYQSGMQAGKEIEGLRRFVLEKLWSWTRYPNVAASWLAYKLGAAKQFSNRLVENWMWVEQVITSTDFENENLLRNHYMAEPHYEEMAKKQADLIAQVYGFFAGQKVHPSIARVCRHAKVGEWHLPFVDTCEVELSLLDARDAGTIKWKDDYITLSNGSEIPITSNYLNEISRMVSSARCSWVSYYMPGDNSKKMRDINKALITYTKLAGSNPKHLSPLQHQAAALPFSVRVGNLRGWLMNRKFIEGENGGGKEVISITAAMGRRLLSEYSYRSKYLLVSDILSEIGTELSTQATNIETTEGVTQNAQ